MNFKKSLIQRAFVALAAACFVCRAGAEDSVHHVNAAEAGKLISVTNIVVLDIRTPGEFAGGHIAGATNIDFRSADFEKDIASLDKSKTYLLHCASGNRSTKALPAFEKLGFKSIYHLDGGIKGWEKAGLPVEK